MFQGVSDPLNFSFSLCENYTGTWDWPMAMSYSEICMYHLCIILLITVLLFCKYINFSTKKKSMLPSLFRQLIAVKNGTLCWTLASSYLIQEKIVFGRINKRGTLLFFYPSINILRQHVWHTRARGLSWICIWILPVLLNIDKWELKQRGREGGK